MKRLTKNDWHDAADLFEQGALQADQATETHSKVACDYVRDRLLSLTDYATGKAVFLQRPAERRAA